MSHVLSLQNLSHHFESTSGSVAVLKELNLEIDRGSMIGVHGSSGSGKTTLMLICGGMMRPVDGDLSIDGTAIYDLTPSSRCQFRGKRIGFLFQTLQLVPYLTLDENIQMANGVSSIDAQGWMDRLGLMDRMNHKPEALSHGQRQRVALARALAHHPDLIIADEPTGNLDEENSNLVFNVLKEFTENGGTALVASHDSLIRDHADRCYELVDGALKC